MTAKIINPTHKQIDKYIPWFFVAFFLVLTGLMGWFAWIANSSDRGVVSKRAYQNGLAYNDIIEKQRAQDALGWVADLVITKTAANPLRADFLLLDKQRTPIIDAQVQLTLIRPTQAGHDVSIMLKNNGNGHYTGETPLSLPGLWEARITAKSGQNTVQTSKRVTLP